MPQIISPSATSRPLAVALVLASVITLPATRAVAISAVSNLGETTLSSVRVDGDIPQWIAGSFLTGPVAMKLDSVDLSAFINPRFPFSTGFTVSLAADPDATFGGIPGTVLASLSGPDPGAPADYNYLAPANLVLDPATSYWIIASVPVGQSQSAFVWEYTSSNAETGLTGWSIHDDLAVSIDFGQLWFPIPVGAPQFQVNVSEVGAVVPEPSTYGAGGAVALMLAAAWRRQRQQRKQQG